MKLVGAATLLLAALVAGCGKAASSDDSSDAKPVVQVSVAPVTQGTIQSVLQVTGTLAPLQNQEAKIAPFAPGRIHKIFVQVGDQVHAGQLVATLDPGPSAGLVQAAQAAVRVAQETYDQARLNLKVQQEAEKTGVQQAQLAVQAATVALQKLRAGSRPQEIAQAQAALAAAQSQLTNADQNLARSKTLFAEGLLARKDLEAAQAQQEAAKAGVTSAQQALSMARQGNRPEDIRAGEVALAQARQQLVAARQQSTVTASKAADVQIAAAQLHQAQANLQSAQGQSGTLDIVSPVAGTVVAVGANSGESVDVTTAVATVVNLARVRLLLNVPADQIDQIKPGDTVEFTSDSNPQIKHTAKVTVINQATDPAANTVLVEAQADNPNRTLRDDGFVHAGIVTATYQNATLVPASALVEKDGKTSVFLAGADDKAHEVEIQVGARRSDVVQATGKIKPGDKVITTGAFELDDGTDIKAGA